MHIEFLLEEPSAEAALRNLVPRILGRAHTWDFHVYQGKPDLLLKLPDRYSQVPPTSSQPESLSDGRILGVRALPCSD